MILTIENTHQLPYPIPKKGMEMASKPHTNLSN